MLEGLVIVRPPVKVARPLLSRVKRLMSWVVGVALVLPAALVLKTKLPPKLPVASCKVCQTVLAMMEFKAKDQGWRSW